MKKQKELRRFSNFGYPTILLSFVMLCVVTFSTLSLVTAYSDYKLSRKVAERTSDYYKACENATDTLSRLDKLLTNAYRTSDDKDSYFRDIQTQLKNYGTITITDANCQLSFQEPISEDSYLSVRINLCYPRKVSDAFYQISEWKSTHQTSEFPEESLNLIF